MSFTNLGVAAVTVAMLAAVHARSARAQDFVLDARTEFTFAFPVELPGVTLPAGSYVFRFIDANTGRMIMEVTARDRSHKVYGLFVTHSVQRPRPSDHGEVRLMETPTGVVHAIRSWWYPGNSIGREFVYPKSQAHRLAMVTHSAVLSTKTDKAVHTELDAADLAYVSPEGEVTSAESMSVPRATTRFSR
jgi:hypothetical protein